MRQEPVAQSGTSDRSVATHDARQEAARILANGVAAGDVPTADRAYLSQSDGGSPHQLGS
jgi:hypothetical protein